MSDVLRGDAFLYEILYLLQGACTLLPHKMLRVPYQGREVCVAGECAPDCPTCQWDARRRAVIDEILRRVNVKKPKGKRR